MLRHAGSPAMVLRYEGGSQFRQTMGPELYMPIELPPCHRWRHPIDTSETPSRHCTAGGSQPLQYRRTRTGSEYPFLPVSADAPGQNLCPMSCNRRLFRGSGTLLGFAVDERPGGYHGMMATHGAPRPKAFRTPGASLHR